MLLKKKKKNSIHCHLYEVKIVISNISYQCFVATNKKRKMLVLIYVFSSSHSHSS